MLSQKLAQIQQHINSHCERSVEDIAAVTTLKSLFKYDGKVIPNFAENDKWPNTDGTFDFVSNPDISRNPEQAFYVQIKGTRNYTEKDGILKFSLRDLAFPAFIYTNVTFDPGILFVVLNPNQRGQERVFWKYMSVDFLDSIDYGKDSVTFKFSAAEEIKDIPESLDAFYEKLQTISQHHLFISKLETKELSKDDIVRTIYGCSKRISRCLDTFDNPDVTRDDVSYNILPYLNRLCVATLLLNALNADREKMNLQLAWERAMLSIETKYLGVFLKGLRYIGIQEPEEGQSERLMLKYYAFLWQIRKYLNEKHSISILQNLEKFPLNTDKVDAQYYEMVAKAVSTADLSPKQLCPSRYYVQKLTPFFVGTERYYEVTLQLAGLYATKFNRITAYTKENISSNYSIQIGYTDVSIDLWGIDSSVKVITNWKVSIEPTCLNKLGKILSISTKLNSKYGEYVALMDFLSRTGLNLLDLIDLQEETFHSIIDSIYHDTKTAIFKEVLLELRSNYSQESSKKGRNVIRYLLLNLRAETIESVLPTWFYPKQLSEDLYISSSCYPFERNPFISNLAGSKTSENHLAKHIAAVAGMDKLSRARPYLAIKNATKQSGEIYFEADTIASEESIKRFNMHLDNWERRAGHRILQENGMVCIEHYEKRTIYILQKLLALSHNGNMGQKEYNQRFLKQSGTIFTDPLKEQAIRNVFVDSQILLIYGAAGTGKTTLINYISNLMGTSKKLFLTKTHTTLQNLKRRIENPGTNAEFISFNSFTKKVSLNEYDVIFVDECSIIDNRTMVEFLEKASPNAFLVFAGDIHQIESIEFGNWFYYAKDIIKNRGSNVELLSTWRTNDTNLIDLWNDVRQKEDVLITERLSFNGPYSEDIGPALLTPSEDDEVVLCLNYDGKFGLNNINNYFQNANTKGPAVSWYEWTYKVGDRILFNESKRFSLLYNNLKGRIVDIQKGYDHITFTVDVETSLTAKDCQREDLEFIQATDDLTRVRFTVYQYDSGDPEENEEELQMKSIIPFQLAYAVSIHKAQGLEYDSVKVIIPSNNAEKITHGIFYTAITRAKKKLKIYWSPETMQEVIKSFCDSTSKVKSLDIIKNKLSIE